MARPFCQRSLINPDIRQLAVLTVFQFEDQSDNRFFRIIVQDDRLLRFYPYLSPRFLCPTAGQKIDNAIEHRLHAFVLVCRPQVNRCDLSLQRPLA